MWIEIFRTGKHRDSSGGSVEYDSAALDRITRLYNEKISDSSSYEAPLVKGHPKDNDPAFGWVKRLKRKGDKIVADIQGVSKELISEVKKGMFKKVSIALYPNLMLRHIGLLGAFPPAVKGLKAVTFTEAEELTEFNTDFQFSESESNYFDLETENEELKESLQHAKYRKDEVENSFRTHEFREFCNSLIENEAGAIILPAQSDTLMELLEKAYQADISADYKEDGMLSGIKEFVSSLMPQFSIDPTMTDKTRNYTEFDDFSDRSVSEDRMELHEKALAVMNSEPTMSYEEAVNQAINH